MGSRVSLREKFKEIGILTFASQYIYENLVYVKKNIHLFEKNCDIHSINTRNGNKLLFPQTRLTKVAKSFRGQCVLYYNKVPEDIQNLTTQNFKNVIKMKLCEKSYYNVDEFLNDRNPWN